MTESRDPPQRWTSPSQKLLAVLRLRESAMQLKVAWFRSQHPDWPEERVHEHARQVLMHARDD